MNSLLLKFNGDIIWVSFYLSSIGIIWTITRYGQKVIWSCLVQVID
jgi:hypothetical protein